MLYSYSIAEFPTQLLAQGPKSSFVLAEGLIVDKDWVDMDLNGGNWYIVHCKPLKEAVAARALREYLNLTVYTAEVQRHRRGEIDKTPFFRGYIFVCADLSQVNLSSINSTPGVIRVLEVGDYPQPLDDDLMHEIMRSIDEMNEQGGLPRHSLKPGDRLTLHSGRFRSLDAIFLGPSKASDRVKVLLKILGGSHEVDVDLDDLQNGPEHPPARRERSTRGRGRPIRTAQP